MKRLSFIILIFLASSLSAIDFEYRFLIMDYQKFNRIDTPLNPENVFKIEDGLSVNIRSLLETKVIYENFKIFFANYGFMPVKSNANYTNRILELYLNFKFGDFSTAIGKKKIIKGRGFLISPSDFLASYFSKVKENEIQFMEGVFIFQSYYYSDSGSFGAFYSPEVDFTNEIFTRYISSTQKQIYGGVYEKDFDFLDFGLICAYRDGLNFGGYSSFRFFENFVFHFDGAVYEKKKIEKIVKEEIPFVGEIYSIEEENLLWVPALLFGATYVNEYFSFMIEYYYNGGGKNWLESKKDISNAINSFDLQNPISIKNLGTSTAFVLDSSFIELCKHYSFVRLYTSKLKNTELALNLILNLVDYSGRLIFSSSYSGWENFSISSEVYFSFGEKYSQFGLYGENGVNIYFSIVI